MENCIVLLSGGIDSVVTLAKAKEDGYKKIYALSFMYGQRHKIEIDFAKVQGEYWGVEKHFILPLGLDKIGGSSLTDYSIEINNKKLISQLPATYVPARNTIFLSYALAFCEVLGVNAILIGANSTDYTGYPDCRPEYFRAFEYMANIAIDRKYKIKIKTPLIDMSKGEIIKEGIRLGVDMEKTFSCYDPTIEGKACKSCDACRIRQKGFEEVFSKNYSFELKI